MNSPSEPEYLPATIQIEISNPTNTPTDIHEKIVNNGPEANSIKRPASPELETKSAFELLNNLNDNYVDGNCNAKDCHLTANCPCSL